MIVFDLHCREDGTRFEGWFRSSADFEHQREGGLLMCPQCGGGQVEKAVMAPAVGRKGNQLVEKRPAQSASAKAVPMDAQPQETAVATMAPLSDEAKKALVAMAEIQRKVLEKSRWVGGKFADEARSMHYGESEAQPIHGETSIEEAEQLIEEGIEIAALPFPVAPPDAVN
ncbi:DUF1178 family protein [Croceicoccus sp. Ery5]|jgi:hypothetical protein|uniref:DUF1178 family protein n=1 Tax=Croceicoccus sp. Ery5 TaxID=1703340 RepID=UPI001E565198|nr:DUF1178 family protein [Croceicoccus sp. Ery5]